MVKITDIRDRKTVFQTLLDVEKICLQVKDCVRSLNCILKVVFQLMVLLPTNTGVAILAGLLVANRLRSISRHRSVYWQSNLFLPCLSTRYPYLGGNRTYPRVKLWTYARGLIYYRLAVRQHFPIRRQATNSKTLNY